MKKLSFVFSVLIALCLLTACSSTHSNSEPSSSNIEESSDVWGSSESSSTIEKSSENLEFSQALTAAKTEYDNNHLSENKIRDILKEKYASDAIDYAFKHLNADWNECAIYYAEQYINNSGEEASEQDWDKMIKALTSEYGGWFTRSQAANALTTLHVPYE